MKPLAMGGAIAMLTIFGALYLAATATRRLFLSGVTPIADAQASQSMWLLDAAFLVRALENIAVLGVAAMLLIALAQWTRTTRLRPPGSPSD